MAPPASANVRLDRIFGRVGSFSRHGFFSGPHKSKPLRELSTKAMLSRRRDGLRGMSVPATASRQEDKLGHRARLRARLLSGGDEALADYEVLEFSAFCGARAR